MVDGREDPLREGADAPSYAYSVFAIVFALMVVDYIDRQIVVSMFPYLRVEWGLSDGQLGALVSIVSISVALATVPLSLLADRWSRVRSMFWMAIVWSCATVACAFAQDYAQLLAARSIVGLGEAAYGAVGAALLSSLFPARTRSTVLGAFLAAALVGSVVGTVLGGIISERWGWRAGFGVAGIPGLILAVLFLAIVRDYRTVALPSMPRAGGRASMSAGAIVALLLRRRTVIVTCIGAGLQLVMVSATYAWMPSYLNRVYGFAPDRAGFATGVVILMGGVGAVLCSVVADRMTMRFARARLYVAAIASVTTAAVMYIAFARVPPSDAQLALIVAGATMMTGTVGPVAAVVIEVVHPALRATAASILALTQNLFGLAAGPLFTGFLSDAYGLPVALSVVPSFSVFAAATFVAAARTYERDLLNVELCVGPEAMSTATRP